MRCLNLKCDQPGRHKPNGGRGPLRTILGPCKKSRAQSSAARNMRSVRVDQGVCKVGIMDM
jgi:hypothetical protein